MEPTVGDRDTLPEVVTHTVLASDRVAAVEGEVLGVVGTLALGVVLTEGQPVTLPVAATLPVRRTVPVTALLSDCVSDTVLDTEGVKLTVVQPVMVEVPDTLSEKEGDRGPLGEAEAHPEVEADPVADPSWACCWACRWGRRRGRQWLAPCRSPRARRWWWTSSWRWARRSACWCP